MLLIQSSFLFERKALLFLQINGKKTTILNTLNVENCSSFPFYLTVKTVFSHNVQLDEDAVLTDPGCSTVQICQ